MNDHINQPDEFPEEQPGYDLLDLVAGALEAAAEDVYILDESAITLPESEQELRVFKLYNQAAETAERVALSSENERVDLDEALQREQDLVAKRYGVMQPELHRQMALDDSRTYPVLIKYKIEEKLPDKSEIENVDDLESLAMASTQEVDRVEEQAVAMHRESLGHFEMAVPDEVDVSGPFISDELPTSVLRELAQDPRVAFIGPDKQEVVLDYPSIPDSLPTTRSNWVHSSGFKGKGVKICVLEGGTLAVSSSCFNISATQLSTPSSNWHMTKSVGIIGNRYKNGGCSGSWQGYAPEASVLIANHSDYKKRYDWARSKGVNVVTMSWHFDSEETSGSLDSRDEYFDYWTTRSPWPTIFTSAGNQASSGAYASGKGYNFFGVGNVLNDGDGNRCNDDISTSSSNKNPTSPHSDREVPEIAAPGSRHDLLGTDFGGTSCATPVAASIAALLMSRNSSLKIWPEAIRAIMMATANYQKADGANWSKYANGKDGTGLLNAWYGSLTATTRETGTTPRYRAHDYGRIRASDFTNKYFKKVWKAKTSTTNARIRVAFTWNSKVTSSSSVLDADLDLYVYDPSGNLVAYSTSYDGSYEFVEFKPNKIGAYTIKVRGYKVPSSFDSYFGVAWTTHYDLCT